MSPEKLKTLRFKLTSFDSSKSEIICNSISLSDLKKLIKTG